MIIKSPSSKRRLLSPQVLNIAVTAFFVSLIVLWACIMFMSPWQSMAHSNVRIGDVMPHPPRRSVRRREKGKDVDIINGDQGRSLHENEHKYESLQQNRNDNGLPTLSSSRKPRVVAIYAYQPNDYTDDDYSGKRKRNGADNALPPYMYTYERIDPYLLSYTPKILRRVRRHDYLPSDTLLSELVHNYKLAISGSDTDDIKAEDPLKHLMLSSKSRDAYRSIKFDSEDYAEGQAEPLEDDECEAPPKNAKWMLHSFPTCNYLHENDWVNTIRMDETKILGHGDWPVLENEPTLRKHETKVALKTIRYEHDYDERNFHRHVRDAIVSERLTSSPRVTDIYAFCGNSGYFEFASEGSLSDRLDQHYTAKYEDDGDVKSLLSQLDKLKLAFEVAAGLADFHDADALRDKTGEIVSAAMVHADITLDQFIKVGDVYKLNDFNRCRFMRRYRNSTSLGGDGRPCGFFVQNNPAKNRSPEEYAYEAETEKIDVYSMGNIFYSILTDMDPWEETKEGAAQQAVMKGKRPQVPETIKSSDDYVDKVLMKAMNDCWKHKPEDRWRARAAADYLSTKLSQLM